MPGALVHEVGGVLHAAEQTLEGSVCRHVDDPHRQRDLLALGAAQWPLPSQRSVSCASNSGTEDGAPTRSASIPATSQAAERAGRCSRAILGSRRAVCAKRTSAELPGSGARSTP
jgi:hypothetical protein